MLSNIAPRAAALSGSLAHSSDHVRGTRSLLGRSLRGFLALVAASFVALSLLGTPGASAQSEGRAVMLGFDGADARTLDELRKANPAAFPNTNRLATEGSFEPLLVEAPPESPVSWAALNTGQNPGKTGVTGFVRRGFFGGSPFPEIGHIKVGVEVPIEDFEGTPIPTWSKTTWMLIAGLGVFLLVYLFLQLLLRRSMLVSAIAALIFGAVAAWGGMHVRSYLPEFIPVTQNRNVAENFWDHAARAGKECLVLGAAQAFNMDAPPGARVLSGFGVPDARGELGNWFLYTTDPKERGRQPEGKGTNTSGIVYRLDDYDGELEGFVYGPENFWKVGRLTSRLTEIAAMSEDPSVPLEDAIAASTEERELKAELKELRVAPTSVPLYIKRESQSALVRIGDQEQVLAEGEWSEYYELTFEINPLIQVHAITRARIIHLNEPHFEMFLDVLHIDPRKPPFWQPISEPANFSAELVGESGLYETYGWPTLTMPFKDDRVSPEVLMEDVEFTLKWREKMLVAALKRDDWQCLFSVFSTTDRVQHMMYQFYDEEHPLFIAAEADKTFSFFGETIRRRDAIPKIYEQMDRILGIALAELEPNDLFLVCSDHGFQSARRQVHVNNWLKQEGYLTPKPALTAGAYALPGSYVDWSKTRAYSLGMGFIYVNLEGREEQGIVKPKDKEALIAELVQKFSEAKDPTTGANLCNAVYRTSEIHSGEHVASEGDLILGFAPGYRISWSGSGGGMNMVENENGLLVDGPLITDNTSNWSGGHVSLAVPDVAGVFLCNRPVKVPAEGVEALHLAPTILSHLGVDLPDVLDNPALEIQ